MAAGYLQALVGYVLYIWHIMIHNIWYIYIIDNHPEVDRDRILIFQNSPLSSGNHPEHSIQEEAAAAAAAAAAAQEEETGWAAAVSHATDVPTGAWKKHKFNAYIGNRWDLYGFFVAAWSWRLCRGMFFFPKLHSNLANMIWSNVGGEEFERPQWHGES